MEKKSLIIGINNYVYFPHLDNCINDAEDIHNFLKNNGFQSTLVIDATQADLISKIANFKDSISENTVSLIYFAGHGLQDDKHNYIVVSDSKITRVEDIKYNCIHAEDLIINNSKTNLHFLILDACRNNPFANGTRGVSFGLLKMYAPAGTLIAFSTSPNSTSIERVGERNGIYTKHLLKNLGIPNIPVELAFKNTRNDVLEDTSDKQVPWEESSLSGKHFSFIQIEEEKIEVAKIINDWYHNEEQITLHRLLPLLEEPIFNSMSNDTAQLILSLVLIYFTKEQENLIQKTMDEDFLSEQLIDYYLPRFQERLVKEDTGVEDFNIEILNKITIVNEINYGYNSLEEPDDDDYPFPQIIANQIKFKEKDGIISFFTSSLKKEPFLKPLIILKGDPTVYLSYYIMKGKSLIDITDTYFKMREPYEKESPNLDNFFQIIDTAFFEEKQNLDELID